MNTNTTVFAIGIVPAHQASCPLCHTVESSVSNDALASGASWRCQRCGQRWDAERLHTAAVYAVTA